MILMTRFIAIMCAKKVSLHLLK